MDSYVDVIFLVLMIAEAFLFFTKKTKGIQKLYGIYTDEAIDKYAMIQGAACVVAAIFFAILCLDGMGITHTGIYPLGKSVTSWFAFGVVIGIMVIMLIYARYMVLNPNQISSVSGQTKQSGTGKKSKKSKKKEEDDF